MTNHSALLALLCIGLCAALPVDNEENLNKLRSSIQNLRDLGTNAKGNIEALEKSGSTSTKLDSSALLPAVSLVAADSKLDSVKADLASSLNTKLPDIAGAFTSSKPSTYVDDILSSKSKADDFMGFKAAASISTPTLDSVPLPSLGDITSKLSSIKLPSLDSLTSKLTASASTPDLSSTSTSTSTPSLDALMAKLGSSSSSTTSSSTPTLDALTAKFSASASSPDISSLVSSSASSTPSLDELVAKMKASASTSDVSSASSTPTLDSLMAKIGSTTTSSSTASTPSLDSLMAKLGSSTSSSSSTTSTPSLDVLTAKFSASASSPDMSALIASMSPTTASTPAADSKFHSTGGAAASEAIAKLSLPELKESSLALSSGGSSVLDSIKSDSAASFAESLKDAAAPKTDIEAIKQKLLDSVKAE